MVVERTIYVGFHSNFGTFKRSRHSLEGFSIALAIHSLDPTRLAITNEFPFYPTYTTPKTVVTDIARFSFLRQKI